MTVDKLELYLARGNAFGDTVEVKAKGCLAWVLLTKRKMVARRVAVFNKTDYQQLLREEMDIRDNPYHVTIAELPRSFYDSGLSPQHRDYLVNKSFLFRSLEDVQVFLAAMGLDIHQLKWSSEIEFI